MLSDIDSCNLGVTVGHCQHLLFHPQKTSTLTKPFLLASIPQYSYNITLHQLDLLTQPNISTILHSQYINLSPPYIHRLLLHTQLHSDVCFDLQTR